MKNAASKIQAIKPIAPASGQEITEVMERVQKLAHAAHELDQRIQSANDCIEACTKERNAVREQYATLIPKLSGVLAPLEKV